MSFKHPRRRLLVHPGFQYRLLLRTVFYVLIYALCVCHFGFLLYLAAEVAKNGMRETFLHAYVGYLRGQGPLLIALVLTTPLVLADLLKFSNRLAGPLYRCRKVMLEMASGKSVPEFKPRKHDLMPEFFEAFNMLIKQWDARLNESGQSRPDSTPEIIVEQV